MSTTKKTNEAAYERIAVPDFDSGKDAAAFVRESIDAFNEESSEAAVARFAASLDRTGREKLFEALLMKEAQEVAALREKRKAIYELADGYSRGEYPYKNRYPEKLYEEELFHLQVELLKLQEWVKRTGARIAIVFEGRDTAGKGGTIGRFTEHLNPRGARIVALPKPTEVELRQWYFQRYVAHLPTRGEMVLFDRSWYNRAGVERVMGFCTDEEYLEFMRQCPQFEENLIHSDTILIKFWLSVTQDEQRKRFKSRKIDPLKRWKLSPIDVASLNKWDDYGKAEEVMFFATNTTASPWIVIKSDDKKRARLNAMRYVLSLIDYDEKDTDAIGAVDPLILSRANVKPGVTKRITQSKKNKKKD